MSEPTPYVLAVEVALSASGVTLPDVLLVRDVPNEMIVGIARMVSTGLLRTGGEIDPHAIARAGNFPTRMVYGYLQQMQRLGLVTGPPEPTRAEVAARAMTGLRP